MMNNRGNLIPVNCPPDADAIVWARALIRDVMSSPLPADIPVAKKDESKELEMTLLKQASTSPNPYIRARAVVLSKLKDTAIQKILEMEKTGKTNDKFYQEFSKQVQILGDKLSDEVQKKTVDKPKTEPYNPSNN